VSQRNEKGLELYKEWAFNIPFLGKSGPNTYTLRMNKLALHHYWVIAAVPNALYCTSTPKCLVKIPMWNVKLWPLPAYGKRMRIRKSMKMVQQIC